MENATGFSLTAPAGRNIYITYLKYSLSSVRSGMRYVRFAPLESSWNLNRLSILPRWNQPVDMIQSDPENRC
jgi:hypothetical protein